MDAKPNADNFNSPVAYRIALVLWQNGGLSDALAPGDLYWLKVAPVEIERLYRLASDALAMVPAPLFIKT